MAKRLSNWLKIGVQAGFGPNFTVEFEAEIPKKFGLAYYGGIFFYQFADGCLLVSAESDLQQDLGLLSRPTRVHAEVDYLGQLTLHAKPFSSTTPPDSHSVPHHFVTLGQSRNCPEHSITSIQDPASSILACLPLKVCPGDFYLSLMLSSSTFFEM